MKKIKQVLNLAKSLGKEHPLRDNYILIKVSSQLPPFSDLARGVSSLDHYEVRHPYADAVIGAFTVWDSKRIKPIVKLGVFQDEHKTIGLIESLYEKIKELYPAVPEDFEKYMYNIWGDSPAGMTQYSFDAHSMNKFYDLFSTLKRMPLRKSDDGKSDSGMGWMVKIKGLDDYLHLVDIVDSKKPLEEGGGNIYSVRHPDGSVTNHHQNNVEDVKLPEELEQSMPVYMRD